MNESLRDGPETDDAYPVIQPQMLKLADQKKAEPAARLQDKVELHLPRTEAPSQLRSVGEIPEINSDYSKSGVKSNGSNTER